MFGANKTYFLELLLMVHKTWHQYEMAMAQKYEILLDVWAIFIIIL